MQLLGEGLRGVKKIIKNSLMGLKGLFLWDKSGIISKIKDDYNPKNLHKLMEYGQQY
jgi:hypothetical protein